MIISVLQLKKKVQIVGSPLLGRYRAFTQIGPAQKKSPYSWTLRTSTGDVLVDTRNTVSCPLQNLAILHNNRTTAHVIEHLLPLKMVGLLGATVETTHCIPYFGNTYPFLKMVLPECNRAKIDVPVSTVDCECAWTYPNPRGGKESFTSITPRHDGRIRCDITINYPGLGERRKIYEFPNDKVFEKIAISRSQGWPPHRYRLSKIASMLGVWRHHNHADWPQELGESLALDRFVDHRCVDLLGAIATLSNGFWFSANITSVCSGHDADMEACRIASRNLRPCC